MIQSIWNNSNDILIHVETPNVILTRPRSVGINRFRLVLLLGIFPVLLGKKRFRLVWLIIVFNRRQTRLKRLKSIGSDHCRVRAPKAAACMISVRFRPRVTLAENQNEAAFEGFAIADSFSSFSWNTQYGRLTKLGQPLLDIYEFEQQVLVHVVKTMQLVPPAHHPIHFSQHPGLF